jgi:hypothetical protein
MMNVAPVLHSLAHREMLRAVDLNNSGNPNLAALAFHRQNTFIQAAQLERELSTQPTIYPHANVLPNKQPRNRTRGVADLAGWGVIILGLLVLAWL